jgi:hypothetical protein
MSKKRWMPAWLGLNKLERRELTCLFVSAIDRTRI